MQSNYSVVILLAFLSSSHARRVQQPLQEQKLVNDEESQSLALLLLALQPSLVKPASGIHSRQSVFMQEGQARRAALQQGFAAAGLAFLPTLPALAGFFDEAANGEKQRSEGFNSMGGQLEPWTGPDFKLYRPATWNEYKGDGGDEYQVKFVDLIDTNTLITVTSSPVKTATSVTALGAIDAVAEKLAKQRNAKVVRTYERSQPSAGGEPILIYTIELDSPGATHTLDALCVSKGKLWRVSSGTPSQNWNNVQDYFTNAINSFVVL